MRYLNSTSQIYLLCYTRVQMKEVADQNSVAYDGEIQAAKIEHQQQMEKIEMLVSINTYPPVIV